MHGTYQMQLFFHSNDPFELTIYILDMNDSRHVKRIGNSYDSLIWATGISRMKNGNVVFRGREFMFMIMMKSAG